MKRRLLITITVVLFSLPIIAEENSTLPLTRMVAGSPQIVLPNRSSVAIEWLTAPISAKFFDETPNDVKSFVVDENKEAWVLSKQNRIHNLNQRFQMNIKEAYNMEEGADSENDSNLSSIAADGKIIMAKEQGKIGIVSLPVGFYDKEKKHKLIGFCPTYLTDEKNEYQKIYSSSESGIYLVGENLLGFLPTGLQTVKPLAKLENAIDFVTGDGKNTFMAQGQNIYQLKDGKLDLYAQHPSEDIRSLAWVSSVGLFYSTPTGAGFLGKNGTVPFLKVKDTLLFVRDKKLYVFMPENFGTLKLSTPEIFKGL